jgi:hypothetical protein
MTEFSRAMDVRAMMHHHPFWIEIFYLFFYACVLPKFPLRTKSRENLKGDFFAYICAQRERDAEKKREKALEREKRNGTFDEKLRLSNVRIDRIRRDAWTSAFASGVVSRGRFRARIFFLFFSLCPAREVTTASG